MDNKHRIVTKSPCKKCGGILIITSEKKINKKVDEFGFNSFPCSCANCDFYGLYPVHSASSRTWKARETEIVTGSVLLARSKERNLPVVFKLDSHNSELENMKETKDSSERMNLFK